MVEYEVSKTTESPPKDSNLLYDFYLHPSADPGQVICRLQLNGNNYERWSKLMRNTFKAKNKLDGTVTKPIRGNDELKMWRIVNSMMVAWIVNSIEPSIEPGLRNSISCVDSDFQLWESLRQQFSLSNEYRVYKLSASMVTFKQDNLSVQAYYGKLKLMWDDLLEYEFSPECCCGNPNCKIIKVAEAKRDREQIYYFLMGLDNNRLVQ
ncbi:unnamed protein product [Arabis nemorensis]|uniref:Retrotransposon Copia-like N-terminal domain-containing protein n=1 Tax=Arabis nemorensis TaxID=586526 RepID=A0A565BCR6_9BRAS|nr:unnamed protein product [Arabis nemorensis]